MRDWSLPEGQSLQQPNVSGSMPSNYGQFINPNPSMPQAGAPPAPPPAPVPLGTNAMPPSNDPYTNGPARHFMEGYCDPNFRPAVSNACVEAQKRQACSLYSQLVPEVQMLLNKTVGCDFAASNAIYGTAPEPGCETTDRARLDMLRKYERDAMTVHALITLPGDVLHGSDNCLRGAGR